MTPAAFAPGSRRHRRLAAEYRMTVRSEEALAAELTRSRQLLEGRGTRGTRKGRPTRETD